MNKFNINRKVNFNIFLKSLKLGFKIIPFTFFLMLFVDLLLNLSAIIPLIANKNLFDIFSNLSDSVDFKKIYILIGILAIYKFIVSLYDIYFKQQFLQFGALLKFEKKLKILLHNKCKDLPLEFFEMPEVLNKFLLAQNSSINIYRIVEVTIDFIGYILGVIVISFFTININSWFIVFIVITILSNIVENIINSEITVNYRNKTKALVREEDNLKALLSNRYFIKESKITKNFNFINNIRISKLKKLFVIENKINLKKLKLSFLMSIFKFIGNIGAIVYSSFLLFNGFISFGSYTAIISSFIILNNKMDSLIELFSYLIMFTSLVYPFFEFMDIDVEKKEITNIGFKDKIIFKDVSFKYPNSDKIIIKNLNLTINKGEKIIIVGENGSGKTTLMKLILGLYTPTSGKITFDGVDISNVDKDNLFYICSSVFQDFSKYYTNVLDNVSISLGKNEKENIINSLKFADFNLEKNDLLQKLGIEFGGKELSGGQWQQLAIARGHYKNADLIVFDEPNSKLDPIRELDIFNKIFKMSNEKTAIIVTHRLGIAKFCDRIIVIKNGEIIEDDSYTNLMRENSLFKWYWGLMKEKL